MNDGALELAGAPGPGAADCGPPAAGLNPSSWTCCANAADELVTPLS